VLSGLIEKTARETWRTVALTCAALGLVMGLFVQILPQFQQGLNDIILQVPFIRALISGLLGMDVSSGLTPRLLLVIVWSHPIVLSIVWGLALVLCTRVPAAEIERGTIDVLLGWPVSRRAVYLSEGLVCLAAGALLLASGLLGFAISTSTLSDEVRPDLGGTLFTLANLFALYLAVAGIAQCIASACDRRGQALGLAVAVLLASYLLSFLSTLWAPAGRLAFLSCVHYYQPAQVMLGGGFPLRDVLVLLVGGATLWALGGAVWSRRSVLTT